MTDGEKVYLWAKREDNLGAFEPFYSGPWAESIFPRVDGTKLEDPFMRINGSWKGTGEAFSLPFVMMVEVGSTILHSREQALQLAEYAFTYSKVKIKQNLKADDPTKQAAMDCVELAVADINERMPTLTPKYDMVADFKRMAADDHFAWGLKSLTEQTFCNLFFAYEDFVRRCLGLLGGDPEARGRDFHNDLRQRFGQMYQGCWKCSEVACAADARHKLVHVGGKADPNAPTYPHYYEINGGYYHIQAKGVRKLYFNLQPLVVKIVDYVLPRL